MINNFLILSDPLHQFKISLLIGMPGSAIFVYFSFFLILGFFLFFQQVIGFSLIEGNKSGNTYTFFFNSLISFLKNNIKSHIQLDRQIFTLVLFVVFEIILTSNINGLIPLSSAFMSHIVITLFLSLGFFIGINLIGYILHNDYLALLFLPKGTPLAILILVIPIEIISYLMRVFSLAIRLFANILAGHSLLKVIASFIYKKVITATSFTSLLIPIILSIATIIIGLLDIFISFLQAYIFFVLLAIYLSHAIKLH